MNNIIVKLIDELIGVVKRNYRKPKLWIWGVILIIIFVLLIPYIDSNFFYYSRMEKRIAILEEVIELDQDKINSNKMYEEEYQSILREIEQQNERSINSIMNKLLNGISMLSIKLNTNVQRNRVIKFLTGAIWWILLLLLIPFMDTFDKFSDKIMSFGIVAIICLLWGWLFSRIPIITPFVNYVVFPLLQLVVIIVIFVKSDSKEKRGKNNE